MNKWTCKSKFILFLLYYGPKLYLPLNRSHFAFSCFLRLDYVGPTVCMKELTLRSGKQLFEFVIPWQVFKPFILCLQVSESG